MELPLNSKFCNECGAPVTQVSRSAEYKQVTVLFADVVHSMELLNLDRRRRDQHKIAPYSSEEVDVSECVGRRRLQ